MWCGFIIFILCVLNSNSVNSTNCFLVICDWLFFQLGTVFYDCFIYIVVFDWMANILILIMYLIYSLRTSYVHRLYLRHILFTSLCSSQLLPDFLHDPFQLFSFIKIHWAPLLHRYGVTHLCMVTLPRRIPLKKTETPTSFHQMSITL